MDNKAENSIFPVLSLISNVIFVKIWNLSELNCYRRRVVIKRDRFSMDFLHWTGGCTAVGIIASSELASVGCLKRRVGWEGNRAAERQKQKRREKTNVTFLFDLTKDGKFICKFIQAYEYLGLWVHEWYSVYFQPKCTLGSICALTCMTLSRA